MNPGAGKSITLRETVKVLRKHYGPPTPLPTADPFELILWENVAYLASPGRRREAFEQLKRTIGTTPTAILEAKPQALENVTGKGILMRTFAAKLRECATIAIDQFGGDLQAVIEEPLGVAKEALRSFPGIGRSPRGCRRSRATCKRPISSSSSTARCCASAALRSAGSALWPLDASMR